MAKLFTCKAKKYHWRSMKYLILGAGGVGSYYGVMLLEGGCEVTFVARGKHLQSMQTKGLHLRHNSFEFQEKVDARSFEEIGKEELFGYDVILLTTKSTTTQNIAIQLSQAFTCKEKMPYIVSLQNGVENEEILCEYLPNEKIIGGLTRKIGAHIVDYGVVESTGKVETIVGLIKETKQNTLFVDKIVQEFFTCKLHCEKTNDIKLELWKKLIINNGVNAMCALLEIKTGELMSHEKLSHIVYHLMEETATAAKAKDVHVSQKDIQEMFKLIKNFDSIKPSMLVDKEHRRKLELDEICGTVVKCTKEQGHDAPYTKTILYLLEFMVTREVSEER